MSEIAVVKEAHGSVAEVEINRNSACERCGVCYGVGKSKMIGKAKNDVGATTGDYVKLEIAQGSPLKAAAIVYLLPLLMFFIGYIVFANIIGFMNKDIIGMIGGIVFLVFSYYIISKYEGKIKKKGWYQLNIVEIVDKEKCF